MSGARSTRQFCESGRAGVARDARQPRRRRPILRSFLARIWRRGAAPILDLVSRAASGPDRREKRGLVVATQAARDGHHATQIAAAARHQHQRVLAGDIRAGRDKGRHRPRPLTARWRTDSPGQCDESANGSIATRTARRALRSRPGLAQVRWWILLGRPTTCRKPGSPGLGTLGAQ